MTTGTTTSRVDRTGLLGWWAAYGACALALAYAAVSFYWAAGGTAGLSTIGGKLEEMARARDPGLLALVLVTAFLKVAYGLLALALVRPFGRAFPRWALLAAAWAGATLLSAYGGLLVAAQALVALGVLEVAEPADRGPRCCGTSSCGTHGSCSWGSCSAWRYGITSVVGRTTGVSSAEGVARSTLAGRARDRPANEVTGTPLAADAGRRCKT